MLPSRHFSPLGLPRPSPSWPNLGACVAGVCVCVCVCVYVFDMTPYFAMVCCWCLCACVFFHCRDSWTEGQGLGRSLQGIKVPVALTSNNTRTGLGFGSTVLPSLPVDAAVLRDPQSSVPAPEVRKPTRRMRLPPRPVAHGLMYASDDEETALPTFAQRFREQCHAREKANIKKRHHQRVESDEDHGQDCDGAAEDWDHDTSEHDRDDFYDAPSDAVNSSLSIRGQPNSVVRFGRHMGYAAPTRLITTTYDYQAVVGPLHAFERALVPGSFALASTSM